MLSSRDMHKYLVQRRPKNFIVYLFPKRTENFHIKRPPKMVIRELIRDKKFSVTGRADLIM